MKKKFIILFTIVVSTIFLSSCFFLGPSVNGNGHVTTEVRHISDFDQIKVSTGMIVVLHQSDQEQVTILADENLHDAIQTEVHGDELRIFTDERIRKYRKLLITVDFKDLENVRTSSGAQVKTDGIIHVKELSASASSGSQLSLNLDVKDLKSKTSSGANIRIQGKTEYADLRASSGSQLKASDLTTENCKADVSSGANISIDITGSLEGEASSGGHIYYTGSPTNTNMKTSSGGEIKKR